MILRGTEAESDENSEMAEGNFGHSREIILRILSNKISSLLKSVKPDPEVRLYHIDSDYSSSSKRVTVSLRCSLMLICWGQRDSHCPHSIQADAFPPALRKML